MERFRARHHHGVGVNRRELLQVGYSGLLGIGVPSIWAGQAAGSAASSRKARAVVLVFLTGAPSHLDTFDLKPERPLKSGAISRRSPPAHPASMVSTTWKCTAC